MKKTGSLIMVLLVFLPVIPGGCSDTILKKEIIPGAYDIGAYIDLLQRKAAGVVMNQTSVIQSVNLADTLLSLGISIKAIYSPEHGFKGKYGAGELVGNDSYAAIPVISLYGKKKKPIPDDLKGVEIMVFDIQDVGVRFYTYISTLHYIMEACAEANIPLIVLDRPNPNGHYIDGPVLNLKYRSFIGMHPVPVVYGMTVGEYAKMINGEKWLASGVQCNLTVIPCTGYTHTSVYEPPVPPSPNLHKTEAVYLFPSTAFFEGTIVSEGRGTDFPFQWIGHPGYPDRSFSFTPRSKPGFSTHPKLKDTLCYGLDLSKISVISLRDKGSVDLQYLIHFYNKIGMGEKYFTSYFELLAGTDRLRRQIISGKSQEEIRFSWQAELNEFKKIRVKYLLYPDF
jgi:uncharacterized protein YbbC (DUF1343 family)